MPKSGCSGSELGGIGICTRVWCLRYVGRRDFLVQGFDFAFDRASEVIGSPPKFRQTTSEGTAQVRQAFGPEHQEGNQKNDNQLRKTYRAHRNTKRKTKRFYHTGVVMEGQVFQWAAAVSPCCRRSTGADSGDGAAQLVDCSCRRLKWGNLYGTFCIYIFSSAKCSLYFWFQFHVKIA